MRAKVRAAWPGFAALMAFTLAGAAIIDQPTPGAYAGSLPELVPAGPLLVLESRDFSSLLHDWNGSAEKRQWLESSNYAVFSRSRLLLRLKDAQEEFAAAAGLPPDISLVESVAGRDSALALYDIGKLEFLYITRMPQASVLESALWRARGNYEPREVAGRSYFVHVDKSSRRVVAFAATNDVLLLATREDLIAGALAMMAGQTQLAVGAEPWFRDAVRASGASSTASPPDMRLVFNLPIVARSPYFRSYWIQGNVAELRQYRSAIVDLYQSPEEIREKRVFWRGNDALVTRATPAADTGQSAKTPEPAAREAALAGLLDLVPPGAGLYRAWAKPSVDAVLDLLEQKVLAPHAGPSPPSPVAPSVSLEGDEAGVESDLETRIDEAAPVTSQERFGREPLRLWLAGQRLEAALEVESSQPTADGVFVRNPSAIVLLASSDWDGDRARSVLQAAIQELWTTSRLGVAWIERRRDSESYYQLDGLVHLTFAIHGRVLIVAGGAPILTAVLDSLAMAAPEVSAKATNQIYAARFNHAREGADFVKLARLIDAPGVASAAGAGPAEGRAPLFFSENIASLSRTLARVESVSIVTDDHGPEVDEIVTYRLRK